jgi:hypothetical protein
LGAASDKLPFTLIANIDSVSDSSSEVKLGGDFNPMMAMMIKGPIGKFIETCCKYGELINHYQEIQKSEKNFTIV